MAADTGVAVEVVGDEQTFPRSLKHHRIAVPATVTHRELRHYIERPSNILWSTIDRPVRRWAEIDGPEVTGLVDELDQFYLATFVTSRLNLLALAFIFPHRKSKSLKSPARLRGLFYCTSKDILRTDVY